MNAEELLKAQAEALEMLADQQMRMIRDKDVQEALKEVKSPAAKRSVGGVLISVLKSNMFFGQLQLLILKGSQFSGSFRKGVGYNSFLFSWANF